MGSDPTRASASLDAKHRFPCLLPPVSVSHPPTLDVCPSIQQVNILLPVLFFTICVCLVILPIYSKPFTTMIGVCIMLSGIPVYFVTVSWQSKPEIYQAFVGSSLFPLSFSLVH